MGGHAGALSSDPAAIYANPATAGGIGTMQIETFVTDTAVRLPDTWGIALRNPPQDQKGGIGILFLRHLLLVDSNQIRSTQLDLAITDKRIGFPVGAGLKIVGEQPGLGKRWTYGFSLDLGFLISLGGLEFGGAAKDVMGMRILSEPRRFEAGAAYQINDFSFTAGMGTQEMSARTALYQAKRTWGYGLEWHALDNALIRGGKFMEQGRQGESMGLGYTTTENGVIIAYSARRFTDDPKNITHWLSYTFSASVSSSGNSPF